MAIVQGEGCHCWGVGMEEMKVEISGIGTITNFLSAEEEKPSDLAPASMYFIEHSSFLRSL